MKKKMLSVLLCSLFIMMSVTGCGKPQQENGDKETTKTEKEGQEESEKEEVSASESKAAVKLRYSISGAPGAPQTEGMHAFKEKLEEISGGNIQVDCYDSGTLFNQNDELEALKAGDFDIGQTTAAWLANDESPWLSMFSMAYLFNDYDHMLSVMTSEIADTVFQKVSDEQGILPLGVYYIGNKCISLKENRPIRSRADLDGVMLRMAGTEAYQYMGTALGGTPVPIAFSELYLALQAGTVDAQDNGLPSFVSSKLYEVQKSVTVTNHVIDCIWVVINNETWSSLSDEHNEWVAAAMEYGASVGAKTAEELQKSAVSTIEEAGVRVYEMEEADREKYAQEVRQYYLDDKDMTKSWDMEVFEKIRSFQ